MTNKIIFIGWLFIAVGLSLCWYPLRYLREMQIDGSQLLFYAFSSASLCTAPWLAFQVKRWQGYTYSLLMIGLSGAATLIFLHYSLLVEDPRSVFSSFCIAPVIILLFKQALKEGAINPAVFVVLLMIIVAGLVILFGLGEKGFRWSELMAFIAGLASYRLYRLHGDNLMIPIASKVSAILICSTWLVGMILIFSPRFVNFPQENAVLMSVFYGVFYIIPVLLAVLKILSGHRDNQFLFWLVLVLLLSTVSHGLVGSALLGANLWAAITLLLVSAYLIAVKLFK